MPDVDVGLGEGGEHGGADALAGGHLLTDGRQDAAVLDGLYLADAARPDGVREPAPRGRSDINMGNRGQANKIMRMRPAHCFL